MTCEHGFIGACPECDWSGQQPERDDTCPRCGADEVTGCYCGLEPCDVRDCGTKREPGLRVCLSHARGMAAAKDQAY